MKFNKIAAMLLAIVMVMGLASAALAEDTLKIGVIGPFTGAAAIYGNACKFGAQVAAEQINAQGGVQVELINEDDEHDPEKSLNAYNNVLDHGAQMIAGTTTTTPCIAVGAQANEDRVFMLTPSASSPDVTANKDNVFQVCFTDPAQGSASAVYIKEHSLATKIAIIYNNADAYSTGIYQTFTEEAATQGLEIVSTSTFTDETTDFSVQVSAAKDAGADLVFLPIYYTPASMILQTAKNIEYAPVFFGVDGMDGILALDNFDASLAEDVILLTPFSAFDTDETVVNFVEKYKAISGGVEPNQFGADSYDAIYALYQASVNAGINGDTSFEDACELLIAQFSEMEYSGLTGDMKWDETGAVSKLPAAYVIKNGAYVPLGE